MKLYHPTYTRDGKTHANKVWWVRFRCNGKDVRKSTGMRDKTVAAIKAAEIVKAAELAEVGVAAPQATHTPLPQLVAEYLADMERRGVSLGHRNQAGVYLDRMLGGLGLPQVTSQELRARLGALRRSTSLTPLTINRHLKVVRWFFNWLGPRWPGNPAAEVQLAYEGERKEKGVFSLADLRALLAAPEISQDRKDLYLVAATTGLRGAELKRLKGEDVRAGVLVVTKDVSRKSKKTHVLPLLPPVVKVLEGRTGILFPRMPAKKTWLRDLQRAGLSAKDPRGNVRTFHGLRASLATILAEANVPLTLAQRILRHSSPNMTANVYVKHSQGALLGAMLGAFGDLTRPNVSHDSRAVPEKALVTPELALNSACPRDIFPPLQPFRVAGVTPEIQSCLARCLAVLKSRPKGLEPWWDKLAEEAVRDGTAALHQPIGEPRGSRTLRGHADR